MTESDYFTLKDNKIYEFIFYYGRVATGILHSKININGKNEYYLIKPQNIKIFNDIKDIDKLISERLIEKVNLDTITNWNEL